MTPTPLPPALPSEITARIREIGAERHGDMGLEASERAEGAREMAEHLLELVCAGCGRSPLTSGCLDFDSSLCIHKRERMTRAEFLSRPSQP